MTEDARGDKELIAAIQRGEEGAFEALYYRHRDWVARLALRFTGDRDLALDVLQETFAYLVRRVPSLQLTSALTTFLYPAVKHLATSAREKRERFSGGDLLDGVESPDPPGSDQRAELAAALKRLPEAQREVILMRFVDGFTLEEIAVALQVPVGTVKSRLHNGLSTLRDDPNTRSYFIE